MRSRKGRTETAKSRRPGWDWWELLALCCSVFLLFYIWIHYENFHFHVTHFYAHLGYPSAQHLVGQRYLRGVGVRRDADMAAHWFSRAAQSALLPGAKFNRTAEM